MNCRSVRRCYDINSSFQTLPTKKTVGKTTLTSFSLGYGLLVSPRLSRLGVGNFLCPISQRTFSFHWWKVQDSNPPIAVVQYRSYPSSVPCLAAAYTTRPTFQYILSKTLVFSKPANLTAGWKQSINNLDLISKNVQCASLGLINHSLLQSKNLC